MIAVIACLAAGIVAAKIVGELAFMMKIVSLEMLAQFVFVPSTAP